VQPSSSGPPVVVIVYLHRVEVPLQQFLLGVFRCPTLWGLEDKVSLPTRTCQ
jgi:hypothetical protein